jgi:hypothetical protein
MKLDVVNATSNHVEEVCLYPSLTFRRKSVEDILKNSSEFLDFEDLSVGNFFSENFMVSYKDAKKKPGWRSEYRDLAQVKRMHMCKSCKSKARKGCCPEYSSGNRVMIKMIVGWNF